MGPLATCRTKRVECANTIANAWPAVLTSSREERVVQLDIERDAVMHCVKAEQLTEHGPELLARQLKSLPG